MIGFLTFVRREVFRFISVFKQTIVPPVVSSFLYIFIFGLSLGKHIDQVEGMSYMKFLIPGLIMMYTIEGSYINTSSSLYISRWHNSIQEILVTPLSYLEMVTAILIGGLMRGVVVSCGVYAVSLLFVKSAIVHPFIFFYMLIMVSAIFSTIGILAGLFAEEWEHLSIVSTFVITPLIFLGGVFHSVSMMPEALRFITICNPIYYMVDGLRFAMLGIHSSPLWISFSMVLLVFAVLFSSAVYLFKIGYKLRV
jgi:ABC-2 type transport system permease protein